MMKRITHLLLALFTLSVLGGLVACNGDKKKLEDKEKELAELRQLAELDKKEMENQYAEFASQYGELKKASRTTPLSTGSTKSRHVPKRCSRNCETQRPTARLKFCV